MKTTLQIDAGVWREVRKRALDENIPVVALVERVLREWLGIEKPGKRK